MTGRFTPPQDKGRTFKRAHIESWSVVSDAEDRKMGLAWFFRFCVNLVVRSNGHAIRKRLITPD